MSYSVEIGLSAFIYLPSFIQLCSDIQGLIGGGLGFHMQTHKHLFFRSKKIRLKTWNRTD
jgi:hypothetical protein